KTTPSPIVAAHQRRKAASPPARSARSARWMVTLLASRQAVVHNTRPRDSATAGVGPTVSFPRKDRYVTISVLNSATSDTRKPTIPHCAALKVFSGATSGGTGRSEALPLSARVSSGPVARIAVDRLVSLKA